MYFIYINLYSMGMYPQLFLALHVNGLRKRRKNPTFQKHFLYFCTKFELHSKIYLQKLTLKYIHIFINNK